MADEEMKGRITICLDLPKPLLQSFKPEQDSPPYSNAGQPWGAVELAMNCIREMGSRASEKIGGFSHIQKLLL
jgi:hypothetical protein